MPEPAPPGILPMFLRGETCKKYGFKTGENVMDLVDNIYLPKEDILKEIQTLGKMSDFQSGQKQIESSPGDQLLFVIDKESKYGETFLLVYTEEALEEFVSKIREAEEAIEAQRRAEEEAEEARKAAEWARLNIVYEDKPVEARPWESITSGETEAEISTYSLSASRELIALEVYRPKDDIKRVVKSFIDRPAEVSGIQEFR